MKKMTYIVWTWLAILVGMKVIFYTRFDFHFSVQAAVITVVIVCPVIVGLIAGVFAHVRHKPSIDLDAWRYVPINSHHSQIEVTETAEALANQVTADSTAVSEKVYENSVPAEDMQAALNELLTAVTDNPDEHKVKGNMVHVERPVFRKENELYAESLIESLPDENFGSIPLHEVSPECFEITEEDFKAYEQGFSSCDNFLQASAPSILPEHEYRAIKDRYGTYIANQITTTPADGPQGMVDVMIGRLVERAGKISLNYGDYHVALVGNVPEVATESPVLVKGQFVTHEKFYVSNWDVPQEGGISMMLTDEEPISVS